MYREGFEVVLFLQSYRLRMGDGVVLLGALIGGVLAGIIAVLTFVGHRHLPYKRMLIVTGVLLVAVLIVMVGEEVAEMQLAGWIGTTEIGWLAWLPDWAGLWFSLFPNVETITAQIIAAALVLGAYALSRYQAISLPKKQGLAPYTLRTEAPKAELVEA
jgi:high-affinity iron transporter